MPLSRNSSSRLRWVRSDERGFALPFSLMALAVTSILMAAALFATGMQSAHVKRQEDADNAYNLAYSCEEEVFSILLGGHFATVLQLVYGGSSARATVSVPRAGIYQVVAVSRMASGGSAKITATLNTVKKTIIAWKQQP